MVYNPFPTEEYPREAPVKRAEGSAGQYLVFYIFL